MHHPTSDVSDLLQGWLTRRLAPEANDWLGDEMGAADDGVLFLALGQVARRIPKRDLEPTPEERAAAARLRPGWEPAAWSTHDAARLAILLSATGNGADMARRLARLWPASDLGELVSWCRGLPLYPEPPRHLARAAEGVRSNMASVFTAVAHDNPYPAENFDDGAWNQMVLKALFIGAPLAPIQGLDARANPALARMLVDYAHERWAAGRPVSPDLWRCVEPFATGDMLDDLKKGTQG